MHYTERRLLNIPAQDLFELVLDVEAYPSFIPSVQRAHVQRLTEEGVLPGELLGELEIGHGGLAGRYTSHVTFMPPSRGQVGEIIARSEAVFFRALEARWTFEIVEGYPHTTNVIFTLDMILKSRLLSAMVTPLLPTMCARVLQAFEARAADLYSSLIK